MDKKRHKPATFTWGSISYSANGILGVVQHGPSTVMVRWADGSREKLIGTTASEVWQLINRAKAQASADSD